jgi:hypothetical protein
MKTCATFARILLFLAPIAMFAQDELHSRPLDKLPMVWDGSFRHFVYSGSLEQALASGADARVVINLLRYRNQQNASLDVTGRAQLGLAAATTPPTKPPKKIDWSVSLGAGTIQALQFPAIFTASQTTPNCTSDYVAYTLNVPGVTGGQANIVGINNLYSGTNPTGQCGTAPTIDFAYNGSTAGGRILVWPDVNFLDPGVPDGSKMAYVETTTKSAILHVLTWKAGEGTSATNAASPVASGKCTATSSCLVSVTFSKSFPSTYGGVYVDWRSDKSWAASDDGTIYEFSCTFTCPLNTNPTIDWTFKLPVAGTGGALPMPSVPAYDLNSKTINVSDALGELWIVNEAAPSVLYGPMMIGGGGCTVTNPPGRTGTPNPCTANGGSYGLTEGVIEDDADVKIYAWTGNNGVVGASASVTQANGDLSNPVVANIGYGSAGNTTSNVDIHFPEFDHGWWTDSPTTAHIYFCGTGNNDTTPFIRSIGFEAAWPDMDSVSVSDSASFGPTKGIPCTPLRELYNPNLNLGNNNNDHDLLVGGLMSSTVGDLETIDISPAGGAASEIPLNTVPYKGGTSGVTWEVINAPQASSIYFATLQTNSSCGGTFCAVKLTQEGLQ